MARIPRGDEDLVCPFHQKSMAEVCHKCPMWVAIRGTDPQTGQEIDDWNCSFYWMPKLVIETAQQSRQAGASTDKVASEIRKFHEAMAKQNLGIAKLMLPPS